MRRQSAAVLGAVAVAMSPGVTPSATAQPTDNQWPPQVYISTTGNVRCVITAANVACERIGPENFHTLQATSSGHVASVASDGTFTWSQGGIGESTDPQNPELPLGNVSPYRWHGWVVFRGPDGTRLTNIRSTHGMLVSIDGETVTPY